MRWVPLLLLAAMLAGCSSDEEPFDLDLPPFDVASPAYGDGGEIPARHTCDGDGESMQVSWHAEWLDPERYALIFEDLDAPGGTYTHWTVWDLLDFNGTAAIPRGWDFSRGGGVEGTTSAGSTGYVPPCPPAGEAHTYVLTVYALDGSLDLPWGAPREGLEDALREHAFAKAVLTGTYARS